MFRQVARLSLVASRASLRTYTTQPTPLRRTITSLRGAAARHASTNAATTARATAAALTTLKTADVFSATATPRRWSSSTPDKSGDVSLPPANLPVEESPSTAPSVAEQISGLSAEDQERIISALQQPEKEKSSVMGGAGIGPADGDMVAAFTCGPCDFRMVKRFSKHAYTKGIVIVECPNCRAKHLLADNLGWLEDEARNIEDILREKGERFTRIGGTSGDFQVVGGDGVDVTTAPTEKATAAPAATQG